MNFDVESRPVIVGIGASAGGLEAIEAFFKEMPRESQMAFVVIQHLSPDYKSLMVELLSRKTEIPVQRAEDGMLVEKNRIYLIPPGKNLTIFHGRLLLSEQKSREDSGINLPVDIFLRSLAEDQGERAVAIILSGTGSDGTRGVRAIKENGGLVFVQDPESAKFDGMPRAAVSTGLADFILPPGDMPSQLLACLRHPIVARQERQPPVMENETGMTRLFSLLRTRTKVDFTYYKPSTIVRRIERRIVVTQSQGLDDYVRYAEQNPSEIMALYRELLIGVTSFFRDPEVWEYLRYHVLPTLLDTTDKKEVRMWVAGCSTGEEAYTLAILCHEVMNTSGISRNVKIFATDIDRDAIAKASLGIYPESIAADLNPAILAKYFVRSGDQYQIARFLREMVVFAQHNLVKDPPFTRIDLVSCRNLLIYLQGNLQQRAMEMFAFSLRLSGILLLGLSETVGDMGDCFETVERRYRIFRFFKKSLCRFTSDEVSTVASSQHLFVPPSIHVPSTRFTESRFFDRLVLRLLDALVEKYSPPAVVVNEHLEVLHILGDTTGIFRVPSGRAAFEITKMVDRELGIPLATGIQKVLRTGEEIAYTNVRLHHQDHDRVVRLCIRPLPGRRTDEPLVVVFFENIESPRMQGEKVTAEYDLDEETAQRIQDLEQELHFTRENLQATVEELETANEELQATNEELLASNEELQSTNEELQSTNEELYTVNNEYQAKILELAEALNDLDNLMSSSQIGMLLLDEDLCIRRYSPQAADLFNLVMSDIGRPLSHLSHRLQNFDVLQVAKQVLRSNHMIEFEAIDDREHWYLIRILPYRVGDQTSCGVVITSIEITENKLVQQRLEESEKQLRKKMDELALHNTILQAEKSARMGSWSWDVETDTVTWSTNLYALFKRDPALGAPSYANHEILYTPESMARLREVVQKALDFGQPYEVYLEAIRSDGSIMHCIARGQAERDASSGKVVRLYGSLQKVDT